MLGCELRAILAEWQNGCERQFRDNWKLTVRKDEELKKIEATSQCEVDGGGVVYKGQQGGHHAR